MDWKKKCALERVYYYAVTVFPAVLQRAEVWQWTRGDQQQTDDQQTLRPLGCLHQGDFFYTSGPHYHILCFIILGSCIFALKTLQLPPPTPLNSNLYNNKICVSPLQSRRRAEHLFFWRINIWQAHKVTICYSGDISWRFSKHLQHNRKIF